MKNYYKFKTIVFYYSFLIFTCILKYIYFCDAKLSFQQNFPGFSVTWSFRNHSNMLICSSINMLKTVVLLHISAESMCIFHDFLPYKSSKEQHLFETEIFCNFINVFTVAFDQFNVSWTKVLTELLLIEYNSSTKHTVVQIRLYLSFFCASNTDTATQMPYQKKKKIIVTWHEP